MEKCGDVKTGCIAYGYERSKLGTARTTVNRDVNGSKKDGVWLSAELHRSPVHEQYNA